MSKATPHRQQSNGTSPPSHWHLYAIGLGSNKPLGSLSPKQIVAAAIEALDEPPSELFSSSAIITSRPIGPSTRTYANASALVISALPPMEMLDHLQSIERRFHRRRYRRWGARTLDLDLLLWSRGAVQSKRLTVPHPAMIHRDFVIYPLEQIAPHWRDPTSGLTIRQLAARLKRAKPT